MPATKTRWIAIGWSKDDCQLQGPYGSHAAAHEACVNGEVNLEHRGYFAVEITEISPSEFEEEEEEEDETDEDATGNN